MEDSTFFLFFFFLVSSISFDPILPRFLAKTILYFIEKKNYLSCSFTFSNLRQVHVSASTRRVHYWLFPQMRTELKS